MRPSLPGRVFLFAGAQAGRIPSRATASAARSLHRGAAGMELCILEVKKRIVKQKENGYNNLNISDDRFKKGAIPWWMKY